MKKILKFCKNQQGDTFRFAIDWLFEMCVPRAALIYLLRPNDTHLSLSKNGARKGTLSSSTKFLKVIKRVISQQTPNRMVCNINTDRYRF